MRISMMIGAALMCLAATSAAKAELAIGAYECWNFGSPRLLFNFTASDGSQYVGYDDTPGAYRHDPSTGEVAFVSGPLAGAMPEGFKAVYEVRNGVPTLSYYGPSGSEALFCEMTG